MEEVLIIGGIGVAALMVLAPVVGFLNPEIGKKMSDSGRDIAKTGIKIGMGTCEKIQSSWTEAGQSWEDLVAEAKQEHQTSKNSDTPPQIITVSDGDS